MTGAKRKNVKIEDKRFSRPYGTNGVFWATVPSDKSLGYYQMSLRDKGTANILLHNT